MNKSELELEITSKSLKVIETIEENDAKKNDANVKSYITNVMEQDGKSVRGRNIGWYTIDEGTENEQAFFRDTPVAKRDWIDKFTGMLNKLSPETFLRFKIESVDEEDRSGYATVIKMNEDKTVSEMRIFMYRDTVGNENTYAEIK